MYSTGLLALLISVMATNQASISGAAAGLRDIKPPVEFSSGLLWLWWLLGALALIGAAVLLFLLLKKRRTAPPPVPSIPAHVRARQQLDQALALIGQPKPFCTAVSDTIRLYLEERFNFHAPERTTEEFLHELQATTLLSPDQKDSLGAFLGQCDLVKFARYEPKETELRALHVSALRLIDETEPAPVQLQVAAAGSHAPVPVTGAGQSTIVNRQS